MQLIIISIAFFLLILLEDVKAQITEYRMDSTSFSRKEPMEFTTEVTYEKPDWKAIDINFLSSYYVQDGNNGAVTGGIGTEYLTDFTQKISVGIPLNSKLTLNADGGYDYYSSASTDNIDFIRASDSSSDMRVHGNFGVTLNASDQHTYSARIGASTEYDYQSFIGGLSYSWLSKDQNRSFQINTQAFIDQWELIYPVELRRQGRLVPTDKRQAYNLSLAFNQVLSKKVQIAFLAESTLMKGLLSTPFHRVYFKNQETAVVEQLPDSRLKIPLGVRLNAYLSETIISRIYYRYYWDDWGIKAHTVSVELPLKLNRFLSLYPTYRIHTQTGSKYFLPYKEHLETSNFYSSDYDLAPLTSHSIGLGMTYSPSGGITKVKIPFVKSTHLSLDGIEFKYGHYRRSTGLNANIVSLGFNFVIH